MALSQSYIYNPLQVGSTDGLLYILYEDKLAVRNAQVRINGIEYNAGSDIVYIDQPHSNPMGAMEYRKNGQWLDAELKPFVVITPSQLGSVFTGSEYVAVTPGAWVSFEKSFGFSEALEFVWFYSIRRSDGNDHNIGYSISKDDGIYMPDLLLTRSFDSPLYVFPTTSLISGITGSVPLVMQYSGEVVEDIITTQRYPDYYFSVAPKIAADITLKDFVWQSSVKVTSITKAAPVFRIPNVTASGATKVVMLDGTVRLLVSKVLSQGFDLYEVSNTGATLMFTDLWDENYHGAQLGWLLDGTLVSYAWKLSYFADSEEDDPFVHYSLYFKRSLDDGTSWEIQQTVAENIQNINGLPILTQDINTGKLTIGSFHSDDMGLTWH